MTLSGSNFEFRLKDLANSLHAEITSEQLEKASQLWTALTIDERNLKEVVEAIYLEVIHPTAQKESDQISTAQKGNDPIFKIKRFITREDLEGLSLLQHLKEISLNQAISSWQSEGDTEEAKLRITKALKENASSLDLSGLNLTTLPPEISWLTNLTTLKLSGNRLISIPEQIVQLANLTHLDLSNNYLCTIPKQLFQMTRLQSLMLYYNHITGIPEEIGQLVNLIELDLSRNQIVSVPEEIGQLVNLIELDLSRNRIVSVPEEIGQLVNLIELDLSRNQIVSVPEGIGQLVNLKYLFLGQNQLRNIPEQIGQLTELQSFNCSYNQLSSLPSRLGELTKLTSLFFKNNPQLRALPLTLGAIPGLDALDLEGTQIDAELARAILDQCRALKKQNNESLMSLPLNLKKWQALAKSDINLECLDQLTESQKIDLNLWLVRLEKTPDFKDHQDQLSQIVCGMIKTVFVDREFHDLFFGQVKLNNEDCEDRSGMAINELYTAWKIAILPSNAPLQDKLAIMTGVAKTLALRKILIQMIDANEQQERGIQSENVEIFLFYETQLKETLQLETAIVDMSYARIGDRSWINKDELIESVKKTYFDSLYDIPIFKKIFEEQLPTEIREIKEKFDKIQEGLEDEAARHPEVDLSIQSKMGETMRERDQALKTLALQWYKDQLEKSEAG